MSDQNKKLNPLRLEGHKLRSRRDFLSQGYISLATLAATPGILSLLTRSAHAAPNCSTGAATGANRMASFLAFDLAGGANLAGSNVIVGKQGGQMDFLTNYSTLGLPDGFHPRNMAPNTELGLAFHPDSGILRGILQTTTATTRANVEGVLFCAISGDDTGNNPHNPMYWVNKAGLKGELTQLLGTQNSESGGNSRAPRESINPAATPVPINRPTDAVGLVDLGTLATLLNSTGAEKVLKAAERMSAGQLAKFQQKDLPQQVADLIQCGYVNSAALLNQYSEQNLNPQRDTAVTPIFTNLANADEAKVATIAKLVLDGAAGAGTVQMGGYDYHTGNRSTGEAQDLRAGLMIGKALQLAAAKGQDLMIYVFSDGGVASSGAIDGSAGGRGKGSWTSDSSIRSSSFALVYKADGRPEMRKSGRQIGHFKDAASVDETATKISNNVDSLAKAVVANYLALHGREGDLAKVVGTDPFGSDLDQYLAFSKLR